MLGYKRRAFFLYNESCLCRLAPSQENEGNSFTGKEALGGCDDY